MGAECGEYRGRLFLLREGNLIIAIVIARSEMGQPNVVLYEKNIMIMMGWPLLNLFGEHHALSSLGTGGSYRLPGWGNHANIDKLWLGLSR